MYHRNTETKLLFFIPWVGKGRPKATYFSAFGLLSALKQQILNNSKTLLANIDKEEKEQI